MKLLACTDKGLIEFENVSGKFQFGRIHFSGQPVAYLDCYDEVWRVAINHKHWGSKIHKSEDSGQSWQELNAPKFPSSILAQNNQATLRSIWNITAHNKEEFYVGVEPAAIFHSRDGGNSYDFMEGLWNHPTRKSWIGGGKGSTNPFLHHIIVDPANHNHLFVAVSCAGVLESYDNGKSWKMINEGIRADFLPNPEAVAGHDPHNLKMSQKNPLVIWQQNHCGIFRTENGGKHWNDLTPNIETSGYGFALAIDAKDDNRAWVIPCESDSMRIAPGNKLSVYSTSDAGTTWRRLSNGLPQDGVFDIVLRHGLDIRNSHLAFGTNNGNLYHSPDFGENWNIITQNLSAVRCVKLLA